MNKKLFICLFCLNSYLFSLTLEEGLRLSIQNDNDIQIRQNDISKIKSDKEIAKGYFLPTLNLSAQVETKETTQNKLLPKSKSQDTDSYELVLKQPVYDGGNTKYEKLLQENRYISAEYYVKEAQNTLSLKFTESYLTLLRTKDLLKLYSEANSISKEIFAKIDIKMQSGYGTKLEMERAKATLLDSNLNLSIQQLNYNEAYENLRNYIQTDIDTDKLLKPKYKYQMPDSKSNALEYALRSHPSLWVTKYNIIVAKNEYERDLKAFYPTLNAYARYKINDVEYKERATNESNEYRVGLELSYNLYNGGKDYAAKKKALDNINEKNILADKTKKQIENRLSLAWNSYDINQNKISILTRFIQTRKEVLDAALREFELGVKDLTYLLDSYMDYIYTKRDLINTSYDLLFAEFRVLEAMGIISQEILDEQREVLWQNKGSSSLDKVFEEVLKEMDYSYSLNSQAHIDLDKLDGNDINIDKRVE